MPMESLKPLSDPDPQVSSALQPRSAAFPAGSNVSRDVSVNLVGQTKILVNPSQQTVISDNMDLIELARQVQTADSFTKANATNKLTMIVEQIRFLQEQARRVLEEAASDHNLHHVPCNFKKIPGKIYYLYEKPQIENEALGDRRLFSMLAPQEWGKSCPYNFLGAYKLQYDMSWTPEERMAEKEHDLALVNRFLQTAARPQTGSDPFMLSITELSDT